MTSTFSSEFVRSIDSNRTVKNAIQAATNTSRPRSRISVTDLVNPMQAYFQRVFPDIRPSPDRLQIMMAGTGFHEVFGKLVSSEEYLEQLLELDGIVGKVDIYEDIPSELKTTSSIPADILKDRSSYFEQLGMYCVMANVHKGRLFVYQKQSSSKTFELKVFEVTFLKPDRISAEMRIRRDLFRHALENKDPSALPRCEWFYRGCDYSQACLCRDKEPKGSFILRDEVEINERDDIALDLKEKLLLNSNTENTIRLNDIVFPRKTVLKRDATVEHPQDEFDVNNRMMDLQKEGFHYALSSAIRYGSPGYFRLLPVSLDSLVDKVDVYDGVPTILRTPGVQEMVDRDQLTSFFSYYFDRLAFECALTNIKHGRLVLYYERIPGEKFMVYDVTFHSRDRIIQEARRRIQLLTSGAPQTALPPCPSWMAKYCEFSSRCTCGNDSIL